MFPTMQMQEYQQAYIQAVAACAGFSWSKPSVDDDSIDIILHKRGGGGTVRSPKLEIQLKCTSRELPREPQLPFELSLKNYDDLRFTNFLVPRILVVLLVPELVQDWTRHNEKVLLLRRGAYWINLQGAPETSNKETKTVSLPKSQRFTAGSLTEIMDRVSRGEQP